MAEPKKHSGEWSYHDDDCMCIMGGRKFCNRDGWVWSCCGACKEDSECSAPKAHPTHWSHPKHFSTMVGYRGGRLVYKTNEEIRAIAPDAFHTHDSVNQKGTVQSCQMAEPKKHSGEWSYHDDDCMCIMGGRKFCNRDGYVWSCCGACKEDSECSAPKAHPTHWHHPKCFSTTVGYRGGRLVYKTNEEIRAIAPDAFQS